MPTSQPELLFHEITHLREPLVGWLVFFHVGTEQGMASLKITLYIQKESKGCPAPA